MIVIKVVKNEIRMCWHATSIMKYSQGILNDFNAISIQHIHKEGNQVADNLIGHRHGLNEDLEWRDAQDLLTKIKSIVHKEVVK